MEMFHSDRMKHLRVGRTSFHIMRKSVNVSQHENIIVFVHLFIKKIVKLELEMYVLFSWQATKLFVV